MVATFDRRHQADFARGYLEDAGIPAVLGADDAGGADLGLAFSRQVRLLVREEDLGRARAVLRDAGVLEGDGGEPEGVT